MMRIIIERTVNTVDPAVKAKSGLKDKLNKCREITSLGKSVRESIEHLHSAKIIGNIAAHDSTIVVDEPDINLALPHFWILLRSDSLLMTIVPACPMSDNKYYVK